MTACLSGAGQGYPYKNCLLICQYQWNLVSSFSLNFSKILSKRDSSLRCSIKVLTVISRKKYMSNFCEPESCLSGHKTGTSNTHIMTLGKLGKCIFHKRNLHWVDELGKCMASSRLQPCTGTQVLETRARAGIQLQLDRLSQYFVQGMVLPRWPSLKPYDFLNFSPGHYKLLSGLGFIAGCQLAVT